ncbi:MAG: cellulose biosynthesis cyclic di-GMP-binding regulatory protein BcsB [Candidatus Anammoxibacter sp.]
MKRIWIWIIIFSGFAEPGVAEVIEIPLYKLAPVETVELKCFTAEFSLPISIPERWEVKKAIVNFGYVNSASLLKSRSRLLVKMNGYPLAQIELSPIVPEGNAKVSIPVILLDPGFNNLSFKVFQHYTYECEEPCAPELWTILKLKEASLYIEYDLKPVPLRLSAVADFLFDPKIFPHGEVNIITEDMSSEIITMAGVIASGISLRFEYRSVVFSMSRDIKPHYDNILIGRNEFVEEFLKKKGIDIKKIKLPLLKITHLPVGEVRGQGIEDGGQMTEGRGQDDGAAAITTARKKEKKQKQELDITHALIVVSGANLKQLRLAAETLAIISFPYPDTDEIIPIKFKMPEVTIYGGKGIITADKKYTFKTLNFDTFTFKGLNPNPKNINFRLPPDFHIKQNLYADLTLNFAYGAGMKDDSTLQIILNGNDIKAIRLDNDYGDIVEGYKLAIPTHLFKAGANVIRFAPILVPPTSNPCEMILTDKLFFTMFGNSTFYFPPMPHLVEMPKLELFFLNGFPITRWPDAHEAMMYITQPDFVTIASAFNLIGSTTQRNGYPLLALEISFDKPENWEGELIVFGQINTLPKDFKELAPLKLMRKTEVPYPIIRSWQGERHLAFSGQLSGVGEGKGFVMQFQSPYKKGRSVTLFTANSLKDLSSLGVALLDAGVSASIKGDLSIIDLTPPDYKIYSMEIGDTYASGKGGEITKLNVYLHALSKYYYIIVVALIIFLSLTIFYLLNKYRRRRIKSAEGIDTEDD